MRQNQALANKHKHDRQSLKDLQAFACDSHIVLPDTIHSIGIINRALLIIIVLLNLSDSVWIGRLLP